jgi:SAM-dependent methyltransferase
MLRIGLDLLVSAELLVYDTEGYRLASHAGSVIAALGEASHELTQLPRYDEALRTGRPFVDTVGGVAIHDPQEAHRFMSGLHRRSQASVPEAVRTVRRAWHRQSITGRGPRVLDLGGGHGCFAAAFARELPDAQVTLFDQPHVIRIARELSGDGFRALGGDYFTDDLGGPYDVVFLSNIIHGESPEFALCVLQRACAALTPAGTLVVRDRFLADDRTGPDYVADFAVTLALNTPHGAPRTVSEATTALTEAGFTQFERHESARDEYGYLTARVRSAA